MNRPLAIVMLILLTVGLAIWLWPTTPTPPSETAGSQAVAPATSPLALPQPSEEPKVQQPGGAYAPSDPRWKWWNEMEKKDRYFEWRMPINFYGKVLDEKNQPVVGAKIKLTWTDLSPTGSSSAEVLSDGSGNFALTDRQGKRLVVDNVVKDGYYLSKTENQFSYEYAAFFEDVYHQPNANKPVIFRMKKKGVAELLVHWDTLYGLKPDGTPHYLNLKSGRKTVGTPSGDLMLQLTRTASNNPDRPNWTLTIQGVGDTGLLESPEEFMFEAPASEYVSQIQVKQSADSPDYQAQVYKNYYVKLADGIFARIETHVFAKYNDQAAINISLYLNPKPGSRNLEYDPAHTAPVTR